MNSGICVATLTAGLTDGRFTNSLAHSLLFDMHSEQQKIWSFMYAESGPRISDTRSMICRNFLGNKDLAHPITGRWPDTLVMIDSDMSWDPDAIHRLVSRLETEDVDVVGGLCFAGSRTEQVPTIYNLEYDKDGVAVPKVVKDYPRDAFVRVGATGAAFVAMSRTCLQKMGEQFKDHPYPWFVEGITNKMQFGEDIAFCMRARALGFEVGVDTSIKIGHWKRFCYDEGSYDNVR